VLGGHYVATVRRRDGVDFEHVNDAVVNHLGTGMKVVLAEAENLDFQSFILVYQKVGGKMAKCI
jgi:hypothetical protein